MKKLFVCFLHFLLFSCFVVSLLPAEDFFWEVPEQFSSRTGKFPVSVNSSQFSAVAWQETMPNTNPEIAAPNVINIHLSVKPPSGRWVHRGAVAGPYPYSSTEPAITNLVIDNRGRILIAVMAGGAEIDIHISENRGASFTRHAIKMGEEISVAPRIFARENGGYLLFVTRGSRQSMSIYYSRSDNGTTWSAFAPFIPENILSLNFLPTHASIGNRDIVFYQSLALGSDTATTYQLYFRTSDDGGRTWAAPRRFTTFNDPIMQPQASPGNFDNQRPHLTRFGSNLMLVWERRYGNQSPQIYCAIINSNGGITGSVERVNDTEAFCQNPIGFVYKNNRMVVWFDNRSVNDRVVYAQHDGTRWINQTPPRNNSNTSFARPIIAQDGLYIAWQNTVPASGRIFVVSPDVFAPSPQISALNFTPERVNRSERPRITWNVPEDTNGIQGFSWSWSREENTVPSQQVMIVNRENAQERVLELNADQDGLWYFKIRAQDRAGNWSEPSRTIYHRKTVPPDQLTIIAPETDENGFLTSANFNMGWEPSSDPYIAGYTWNLQFLGVNENAFIAPPPSGMMGVNPQTSFLNQDNGIWGFSVSAIDLAGNIGPASNIVIRNNKFIPYTIINLVDARQDDQGVVTIRILGRGFLTDGRITSIVLEYDDKQRIAENFEILSDREIDRIVFDNVEEGNYRLRIEHSSRGWYTAAPFVAARTMGTVKYGDYTGEWRPSWNLQDYGKLILNPGFILAALLVIFCIFGLIVVSRGIGGIIKETIAVKQEATAIITGGFMPMDKKQKLIKIEKKGLSLSIKLAIFIIVLVAAIVGLISIPLYMNMTQTQRTTLLQSLMDRSTVLLEGIVSSARTYMPMAIQSLGERGSLEMMNLPAQSSAIKEAKYITIIGYGIGSIHTDHVWATNDDNVGDKIDTNEFRSGISRYNDPIITLLDEIGSELNEKAKEDAAQIADSVRRMNEDAQLIPFTEANMQRILNLQADINSVEAGLTVILSEVSGGLRSYPEFHTNRIDEKNINYTFYAPIMYRQGADDNFFRGFVMMEVSLELIITAIQQGQKELLRTILIFASIALGVGIVVALILSYLVVIPIRRLVRHIEKIRDTEDKSKLAGLEITIKSKDEIAILGNTINDMTSGLVKAALAASDLSIGKEIQKKFIPLETDTQGNKLSSGFKKTQFLDFFGYYEGAKGVSGDYFDYQDLDGRYFAIIKCDVAGKGIPAALIMIQVATMFLGYFRQWKASEKSMHIEDLVYQINDFIEALAFKGRFAAFTLCIFDSETGIVRFCNAGDNIINLYDASEGKLKTLTLPMTPATGVLPNFMIESTGGYKVQTVQIDKGDILLLFTDGIEEAKRKFRNNEFKEIVCTKGPINTPHGNHVSGQADEELSPERVKDIINAVMLKKVYNLKKYHNPEEEYDSSANRGDLQFDFSTCEGHVEEVIMAMVSVEKMFRCYKPANAGEDSRVLVDKKIDEFLKKHFVQYRRYCSHTREYPESSAYMYYTHIMEDEQYDDLTILGIKRN